MNNPRTSSTVSSALEILRLLSSHPAGKRLTEVAVELGIGKSSAHVLLTTLVVHGFAQKLRSGNYALGLAAFEVGSSVPDSVRYGGALARPMRELADKSGEAVSLAVVHGKHAVMVQRFESQQILRAEIRIGTRMPLFACASGKYFLAYMGPEEVDGVYPDEHLPQGIASSNLRTKKELVASFENIRTLNYATNVGEYTAGIDGLATGVFDASGALIAALSIAGPSNRFDPEAWIDDLFAAARQMTQIQQNRP